MGGGEGGDICRRRPCNCSSGWDGKTFGSRAPRNRTAWSNNSGGSLPRYSSFLEARVQCDLHPSIAHEQGNEDMRGDRGHLSRGELSHQRDGGRGGPWRLLKASTTWGLAWRGGTSSSMWRRAKSFRQRDARDISLSLFIFSGRQCLLGKKGN